MFIKKIPWLGLLLFSTIILNFGLYDGCCLNVDSYHYADSINEGYYDGLSFLVYYLGSNTEFILLMFHVATVTLLFFIIKKFYGEKIAFITGMLYVLDPLVIFNTQLGLLDKNPIIMFIMLGFFYAWFILNNRIRALAYLVSLWALAVIFWDGFLIILFIITATSFFTGVFWKDKKQMLFGVIVSGIAIILILIFKFSEVMEMLADKHLIAETMYGLLLFSPMYLFYIFVLILNHYKSNKLFYAGALASAIPFLFMFRFLKLFLIFVYLSTAILLTDKRYLKPVLIVFAVCVVLSYPGYLREPMHNDEMIEAVNYGDKDCLYANWGKGHIYNYFTDKKVYFKAAPRTDDILEVFAYGNQTNNCSYLYTDEDIEYFKFMADDREIPLPLWIEQQAYVKIGEYKVIR